MRARTAAALAAGTFLGTGAAAVAAGRWAAGAALPVRRSGAPVPAGFEGPALTVHAIGDARIALTRSLATLRPGVYGVQGKSGHAQVGPVLPDESARAEAHVVLRRLLTADWDLPRAGSTVRLTPQLRTGDPQSALGIDFSDVDVPGELGALPAWFVPGDRKTWVLAVHGLGTTRELALNLLPFLREQRLPVLALAYRGDAGAPGRAPRRPGGPEWHDLDAAVRYAVRYGARRVVLLGWSSGATMALRTACESPLRERIAGLVLDSPVLDPAAALRALAAAHHVPKALLPLAARAARGEAENPAQESVVEPSHLRVPTLLVHGPDDTVADWEGSRALAAARPARVTLHTVPHAPHSAMWNADPDGYEQTLGRFLIPLM
ncbi:alpha/beta hydrolase family protein [Streptomyces sulphureus]|uniref:alpha/beta hydrolase family protein n=1 Tax=Streptomyces sulphureus TaxID=47758 RepID=UPI00037967AE|nr:alpha/beta hydrolase [Streptomyces sulphureus]